MTFLILADSSLEVIPPNLRNHPSVKAHAKKLGKPPSNIILDNSWHFGAMKGIENELKRGRPDIVHLCLLAATSIPLYIQNKISIFVHTIDNNVILVGSQVRIPKSYHRFEGLMEKLFREKEISFENKILFQLKKMSFKDLIEEIDPSQIIGLSSAGNHTSYEKLVKMIDDQTCIVVGGFQKGDFSKDVLDTLDSSYSVDLQPLEGHVIISRVLYEYEKTIFM